mmetsp:Transcript_63677/g.194754  ORF Transcript_63677/g.194754 Transcript_63677/m.194754 type:complete len:216 (+) Transcript_63677:1091-1738(+)
MAALQPAARLRDVAPEMVRLVLLGPPEVRRARCVRFARRAAARLSALDAHVNGLAAVGVVDAAEAKLLRWAAARLDTDGAGEGDQVAPGHPVAELVLDLPEQAPGLVQVRIVAPLVLRPKALPSAFDAAGGGALAVDQAEGPRGMPGQAPEEARVAGRVPILRPVGRPALLRGCHEVGDGVVQLADIQRRQRLVVLLFAQAGRRPAASAGATQAA